MKFTMNVKNFKAIVEKAMTVQAKKPSLPLLNKVELSVEDGILNVKATNFDHYAILKEKVTNTENGTVLIDKDDMKVINKMSGNLTFSDNEETVKITNGTKKMTVPIYGFENKLDFPSFDKLEIMLSMKENWLLETLTSLSSSLADNENQKIMCCYNFNLKHKRVETLDGYRIAMRNLENQNVLSDVARTLLLHGMAIPFFKKSLDKKSEKDIMIYMSDKYVKVVGNDFEYIQRKIDGMYFDVESMLNAEFNWEFTTNVKEMLDVMKYDADIVKAERKPVILHSVNSQLYTYARTSRYELLDKINTNENSMNNNLYIGFNPNYFKDALSVVWSDNVRICGTNPKAPLFVYDTDNDYSFLILPVNVSDSMDGFDKCIAEN